MFTPKFVVSIVFILYTYPVLSLGHWNNVTHSNYSRIELDANNRINGTEPNVIKKMPMNDTKSDKKNIVKMQRKQNYTEDDDEFHFLITGGYRPEKNNLVKYLISLRSDKEFKFFGDNHFCAGSIISKKAILTAAHCFFSGGTKTRPQQIKVVAGTPRRLHRVASTQELAVDKIRTHSKYSPQKLINDIAILKLKDEIKFHDEFVDIAPIADEPPIPGMKCTIIGWGTILQYGPSPDEVLNGDLSIRENSYCTKIPGFEKGMLCANDVSDYEVDSCQGDSGGPLICNGKVVGVVSFGYGCGEADSAGVYSDVNYFHKWIIENSASRIISPYKMMLMLVWMFVKLIINIV